MDEIIFKVIMYPFGILIVIAAVHGMINDKG